MARPPMMFSFPEPVCDRTQYLNDQAAMRQTQKQQRMCHLSNTRPGYQKIMNTKLKG